MVDLPRSAQLRHAIELMFFAYREFTERPDRILDRRGLGRVHHRILYFVGRNPEISVSGLLDILAVSKQALSAPLRQLTEMGLIGIGLDPSDRRVKRLTLTAKGMGLESELTGVQMRRLSTVFEASGPAQAAGWLAVMTALAASSPSAKELEPPGP